MHEIAEALEEDTAYIQSICDIAALTAPEYDTESILKQLQEQHINL